MDATPPGYSRAKQAPDFINEAWPGSSWIVELVVSGQASWQSPPSSGHLFLTSLRTTPKALLQLVRDRWCIESWALDPRYPAP